MILYDVYFLKINTAQKVFTIINIEKKKIINEF